MNKKILTIFFIFTVFVSAGCLQEVRRLPEESYLPTENPMAMIARYAQQTATAQALAAGASVVETPNPPTSAAVAPQNWAFVIVAQGGDIFGVDDAFLSGLSEHSISVNGVEYVGVTLFDVLSRVDSVGFGASEIQIHGDTVFVYGFGQISNQSLSESVLTLNPSGGFDLIGLQGEIQVTSVKVIRVK